MVILNKLQRGGGGGGGMGVDSDSDFLRDKVSPPL